MESYAVDADAEQVVRWLILEQRNVNPVLQVNGRRTAEVWDIPVRIDWWMGDEEREDLGERVTIAILEIAPIHAGDGWSLRVTIEDDPEPGRLDDEPADDGALAEEESIDLATFYEEFILPRRGIARLTADVEGRMAQTRLASLLSAIETNSHLYDEDHS